MIKELTPEQIKLMDVYKEKWLKIGLSTEPTNKVLAEDALNRAYKAGGLTKPKQIIWTTSPLAGLLIVNILKNDKLIKKILKDLDSKKDMELGSSVRSSVESSVWSSVWSSVRSSVESSVRSSVESSVWSSVESSVESSLQNDPILTSIINDAIFGQQDAGWLSFYDYFREVCNLKKETEKLVSLIDLAKHSNWIYPYKNIAVISEKPTVCKLQDGKIHCENGPAILYKDGFSVYALNGKILNGEKLEKIKHKEQFNNKMDNILSEVI